MGSKNKAVEEVEKLLHDIGIKIDELIVKGKEASGEAKKEIEKKIVELKLNKEDLEKDFQNKKTKFEKMYNRKKTEMDPKFKKSRIHLREAFIQLNEAVKALFSK